MSSILLVDDSSVVRRIYRKALGLSELGIEVIHEADSGSSALDVLNAHEVDLMFLDLNMPEMNGMELLSILEEEGRLDNFPIVVISAQGSKEIDEALEQLGVAAVFRKPLTPEEIVNTVRRFGPKE